MMNTSRLHRIDYGDRGAMGGYSAFDVHTDCKTPAYMDGNMLRVPAFKRECVAAWQDSSINSNDPIKQQTLSQILLHIKNSGLARNVDVGMLNEFNKIIRYQWTKISDVPSWDPGFDITKDHSKDIPVKDNDPSTPGPNQSNDISGPALDALNAVGTVGDIATFLSDPSHWLSILAMGVGGVVMTIAVWKGIQ